MIKLPFNVEKKSYEYWDATIRQPMTVDFVEETELKGTNNSLKVYKFEGEVPETDFGFREVPRGLFGLEDTGSVEARRTYQNTRTLWVEPVTGVMIKVQEAQTQYMYLDEPGVTPVLAMVALAAVKGPAPIVLGILGTLSLLVGIALALGFSRKAKDASAA